MSFKTISASSLLFGAGVSALCTLTMAQAQTIPYGSAHSAPGAVYSSGYYAVSPSISSAYYAPAPVYSTVSAPVAVPVPASVPVPVIGTAPCPVYSDYDACLYQLYGYVDPSLTGGCAAGVASSTGAVQGGVSPIIASAPTRTFSPTPVSVTTTQETVVDGVEVFEEVTTPQAPAAQAEQTGAGFRGNTFVAPQSRFRASANVAIDLGYQVRHEIQPVATNLNFNGFSSVVIDRRNGSYSAQTLVEDPENTLSKAYLNAQAPTHSPFVAEGSLVDQYGNSLEFYVDPYRANLPTTRVRNANPLVANGSVSLKGEFYGDSWSAGAAVGFDVSPILQQQPPALSTANVYVNTRFGTVTAGRGVGLPYPTRSYEVISGGGYSFADFGDYQSPATSAQLLATPGSAWSPACKPAKWGPRLSSRPPTATTSSAQRFMPIRHSRYRVKLATPAHWATSGLLVQRPMPAEMVTANPSMACKGISMLVATPCKPTQRG